MTYLNYPRLKIFLYALLKTYQVKSLNILGTTIWHLNPSKLNGPFKKLERVQVGIPCALEVIVAVNGSSWQVESMTHRDSESRDVHHRLALVLIWKINQYQQ